MSNNKDTFLNNLKNSLENYEVSGELNDWDEFEQKLDAASPNSGGQSHLGKIVAGVAATAAIIGGIYYFTQEEPQQQSTSQEVVEQQEPIHNIESATTVEWEGEEQVIEDETATQEHQPQSSESSNETLAESSTSSQKPNSDDNNKEQGGDDDQVRGGDDDPEPFKIPTFRLNRSEFCLGQPLVGKIDNPGSFNTFKWVIDNRQNETMVGAGIRHEFNQSGTYEVTLTAYSEEHGKYEESVTITVYENPLADFETTIDYDNNKALLRVSNHSENAESFKWYVNGALKSESREPALPLNNGSHKIELVATSGVCEDRIHQTVDINMDKNFLLAPNAFTPDGDGINDNFLPRRLEVMDVPFTMQIFNPKTGQRIFETTSVARPWDGVVAGGKNAEYGVYVWRVTLDRPFEGQREFSGTVMLLR